MIIWASVLNGGRDGDQRNGMPVERLGQVIHPEEDLVVRGSPAIFAFFFQNVKVALKWNGKIKIVTNKKRFSGIINPWEKMFHDISMNRKNI